MINKYGDGSYSKDIPVKDKIKIAKSYVEMYDGKDMVSELIKMIKLKEKVR